MAGPNSRKRDRPDAATSTHSKSVKGPRPTKKQRKVHQYHSSSSEDEGEDADGGAFTAVNVMDDSDNDSVNLDKAIVDNLDGDSAADSDSDSEIDPEEAAAVIRNKKAKATGTTPKKPKTKAARDAPKESDEESSNDDSDEEMDDEFDVSDDEEGGASGANKKKQSKRNDPSAFATSISKILSTKLSVSKQADPVLSRSLDAKKSAQEAVDTALEAKARRKMREQKKLASEKGRVKDVLVGATDAKTGDSIENTGQIQQTERRLRKVAHRGVIMLFRAVREAQERAVEADKGARKEGIIGAQSRNEKVNEMSKQGFLDLIAGSGGKLKKGGLQEA
ncbi:Rrp15p-domain-containing protein [Microdochium bolleyi]|uniref:Rrp15p-domain-containing protein n=1 Tax=Microdochium bolleyi TaxID=196109 RepID=A0A136J8C3_9PEZI|nr:Rrp15p-domain-containing protein [Microdochium bolleyi]